jgi:hypothetical protein
MASASAPGAPVGSGNPSTLEERIVVALAVWRGRQRRVLAVARLDTAVTAESAW